MWSLTAVRILSPGKKQPCPAELAGSRKVGTIMSRFVKLIPCATLTIMLGIGVAVPWAAELPKEDVPPVAGKNRCLLESEGCPSRKMTIVELIAALRLELSKGETVYTPSELRILEDKLGEYELMYERLMFGNSE